MAETSSFTHKARPEPRASLVPLLALLLASVLLIPFNLWVVGGAAAMVFFLSLPAETPQRQVRYLALAASLLILVFAPISTDLDWVHIGRLALHFALALLVPWLILRRRDPEVITYKFWPDKLEWVEVFYTAIAFPLAYGILRFYFVIASPEVPFNWTLPPEPDNLELFKLFMGINGVGIWDELFFINTSYAIIRALFPYKIANPAQAVIYTTVLWTMAFRGIGPILVYLFALTQGAMYERSKSLLWVLIVHLIVDYFLFQRIIASHYPNLSVWWH